MLTGKELGQLDKLTEALKGEGFDGIRYQITHETIRVTEVRNHKVELKQDAKDKMYVIEAVYAGKKSRTYWTQMPDISSLTERLKETAKASGQAEDAITYQERETEPVSPFVFETHEDAARILLRAERSAYEEPEVWLVERCIYEQYESKIYLLNADGTMCRDSTGYHCMKAGIIARRGDAVEHATSCRYGNKLEEMDAEGLLKEAAENAIGGLGGKPVESGPYKVILKNTVMASLLEAYLPAFYADGLRNHLSGLSGKISEAVACELLSLREVPGIPNGKVKRTIDDEGTQVCEKYLISRGIFTKELSNRAEAALSENESTGNGFKASLNSEIGIGVTNVIMETEESLAVSMGELTDMVQNGILVMGVDGVFAGTNVKDGAFSLIIKGRMIRDGKEAEAFRETTMAGNFYELLNQIQAIGNDHSPTWPGCECVLAPSVYVGTLALSGI